jgi:hypothetical protein
MPSLEALASKGFTAEAGLMSLPGSFLDPEADRKAQSLSVSRCFSHFTLADKQPSIKTKKELPHGIGDRGIQKNKK